MIFTKDEQGDRAFLRDVLEIPCIDSGGGWLIFKLPPAELGVHEGENDFHQIYFMCDDIDEFARAMSEKGVEVEAIHEQSWGRSAGLKLPGGGTLGVYQASHARP
jgi:hypothetical protein